MKDFSRNHSSKEITGLIEGKMIARCEHVEEHGDTILQFVFMDGSVLRLRYDWIYEWEVLQEIKE